MVPLTDYPSTPAACALVALAVLIILVARYPDRGINTSPRKGIPGPRGLPLVGNLFQVLRRRDDIPSWLHEMEGRYGPLFTYTMVGYGRAVVVNHVLWVEHVKKREMISYGKSKHALDVLTEFLGRFNPIVQEGETWKHTRRLAGNVLNYPLFDRDVSRAMAQVLPLATEMLSSVASQDLVIDWRSLAGRLALAIFFRVGFRVDPQSITTDPKCLTETNHILEALRICCEVTPSRLHNPLWRLTEKFDGRGKRVREARAHLWKICDEIIEERLEQQKRGELEDGGDFLTQLLPNVADKQVARESMFALLFAGQESLLNLLCWSLYELSRSPEWRARMRQEGQEQNPTGAIVGYNAMQDYPVHLAVMYETLRLWPGVPRNSRVAKKDDILPGIPELNYEPVHIFKGDSIIFDDHVIMRRTDVWGPDANEFNPGRHLDKHGKFVKPPMPQFHAFGSGIRLCPGVNFASYEFVVIWTTLLPLFEFEPVDRRERKMAPGISSAMDGPFHVRVRSI